MNSRKRCSGMNETAVPVISFKEAYREMLKGSKVAHVDFKGGYWAWEKGTIMIHCHDGKVLDIRETDDVSFTFGFITDDRWYVKEAGL